MNEQLFFLKKQKEAFLCCCIDTVLLQTYIKVWARCSGHPFIFQTELNSMSHFNFELQLSHHTTSWTMVTVGLKQRAQTTTHTHISLYVDSEDGFPRLNRSVLTHAPRSSRKGPTQFLDWIFKKRGEVEGNRREMTQTSAQSEKKTQPILHQPHHFTWAHTQMYTGIIKPPTHTCIIHFYLQMKTQTSTGQLLTQTHTHLHHFTLTHRWQSFIVK